MTNQEIILEQSIRLMQDGVIAGSGVFGKVQRHDGSVEEIELPEQIHTYRAGKEMGRQVQKGQKAIAKFTIWKYIRSKGKDENAKEQVDDGRCIMKTAAFFTEGQTEII